MVTTHHFPFFILLKAVVALESFLVRKYCENVVNIAFLAMFIISSKIWHQVLINNLNQLSKKRLTTSDIVRQNERTTRQV